MVDRIEVKKRAKEFAFKNLWAIWKPTLMLFLIIFGVSFVAGLLLGLLGLNKGILGSIILLLVELAIIPLQVGYMAYLINVVSGKEVDMMECFKSKFKYIVPILIVSFVASLVIGFMAILLVVPGIIFAYKYRLVNYIMAEADEESIQPLKPLSESDRLMKGHKMNYFIFELSFIGWALLGSITLGIAYIWVMPYMATAQIYYYQELKKLGEVKK